jgi:hypothetical protein
MSIRGLGMVAVLVAGCAVDSTEGQGDLALEAVPTARLFGSIHYLDASGLGRPTTDARDGSIAVALELCGDTVIARAVENGIANQRREGIVAMYRVFGFGTSDRRALASDVRDDTDDDRYSSGRPSPGSLLGSAPHAFQSATNDRPESLTDPRTVALLNWNNIYEVDPSVFDSIIAGHPGC